MKNPIATALSAFAPVLIAPAGACNDVDPVDQGALPPGPPPSGVDVGPRPPNPALAVALRDVVLAGSGCRGAGSAVAALSPEGDAIYVDFDALGADTTTGPAKQARSCTMVGTLEALPGHRVAITGISAVGDVDLNGGASARLIVRHFVPGNPGAGSASRTVVGPFHGMTPVSSVDPSPAWSGCGASQRIAMTATVFVDAGRGRAGGSAGIDGLDLELAIEPCP